MLAGKLNQAAVSKSLGTLALRCCRQAKSPDLKRPSKLHNQTFLTAAKTDVLKCYSWRFLCTSPCTHNSTETMALTRHDVIELCQEIAREENLRVAVSESGKGALITGAGAFIGGLCGGPIGLAVGGSLAACYSAVRAKGKFKSVVEVIQDDMTERQKEQLVDSVKQVLLKVDVPTVMGLLITITSDPSLKLLVAKEITRFITSEMHLAMM